MGSSASRPEEQRRVDRAVAITGAAVAARKLPKLPPNVTKAAEKDLPEIEVGFGAFEWLGCN